MKKTMPIELKRFKMFCESELHHGQEKLREENPGTLLADLPKKIENVGDAEKVFLALANHDKMYHFDDDPKTIDIFTEEEAELLSELIPDANRVCAEHFNLDMNLPNVGLWDGLYRYLFPEPGIDVFGVDDDLLYIHEFGTKGVITTNLDSLEKVKKDAWIEETGEYDPDILIEWMESQGKNSTMVKESSEYGTVKLGYKKELTEEQADMVCRAAVYEWGDLAIYDKLGLSKEKEFEELKKLGIYIPLDKNVEEVEEEDDYQSVLANMYNDIVINVAADKLDTELEFGHNHKYGTKCIYWGKDIIYDGDSYYHPVVALHTSVASIVETAMDILDEKDDKEMNFISDFEDFDESVKVKTDKHIKESVSIPSNILEFADRKGVTSLVKKVARWAEKSGKRITGGTAIGKNYDTIVLDLSYQGSEIYIDLDDETVKLFGQPINSPKEFAEVLKMNESVSGTKKKK
jgi:hypothetical protein